MKRYNNYHKHTYYQNIFTPDTHTQIDDYCKRAIELGHNSYFTTEHGYGGDVFACKEACEKYGLKCVFGYEGYIVKDAKEKDDRNYHIIIIPRTNLARRKVNLLISNANIDGFYRKPRIFLQELLSFDKDDIYITTACVASFLRDDDGIENIFIPLYNKFSDNLFIEVQPHNHPTQIEHNKKAIYLQEKYGLRLISANDSHYILPEDTKKRNTFLMGKHINYGDEDSFILDYPEYDTIIERYIEQGVLTKEQAIVALDNTLIFDECEEIDINREPKMPTIYPNLNIEEKFELLKDLAYRNLYKMFDDENTPEENKQAYIDELNNDLKVVKETSAMNTADYFLLDNAIVSKAVNDYGGIITKTGRGSGGAFLLNKTMGLTQLDKFSTNIPMYSERFMSTARILENRSFPDVDCNLVDAEPFVKASRDYLGYHGCYPMVAFGTMEISESFRNSCRARNVEYEQLNEAAKNIEKLTDDEFFGPIIKEAEGMCGVIVNMSIHPCSYCLFNGDLREEIGIVRSGEDCVAIITSTESDNWKYVKNDYLRITALSIISKVFQKIGRPIMSLKELRNSVDDKVWDIYAKGLTCTINQVDSDWGTSLAMRYKPMSIDEVAMLTAAIRPSFDPWRDTFINRENYTTGNKYMDKLLEKTGHYILFQENLMQYFEWLGVTPAESIGIIKKISKKKIHKEDFDALENRIKKSWIEKTGAIDGFQENWDMVQSCMFYSFNSPHGVAYGYDSVYGAYLKSHYPFEYYSVVLELYKDDQVRTRKLTEEMKYFGISLEMPKFGKSRSTYTENKELKTIYKGLQSIKFLNAESAEYLYSLKDNKYETFLDLLLNSIKTGPVDSRKLDILIKLEYFSEFGKIKKLLKYVKIFEMFKKGDVKVFDKQKLFGTWVYNVVKRHSSETNKQFRDIDLSKCFDEIKLYIENDVDDDVSISQKIEWQLEYLGYVDFKTNNPDDRRKLVILEVRPLISKKTGKIWKISIDTISIGTGKRASLLLSETLYRQKNIKKDDVIFVGPGMLKKEEWGGRTNWLLLNCEKIYI